MATRYAADHAAFAFGIPRIAPVLIEAAAAEQTAATEPAAGFPQEVEDLTESLTADEREAAEAAFSAPDPAAVPGEEAPGGLLGRPVVSEPVTAALRMPTGRDREPEPRPPWGGTQKLQLTERLTIPAIAQARPPLPAATPMGVLDPGEAATTTVTLPAIAQREPAGRPARGIRESRRSAWELAKWALLGAGATSALGLAVLLGRALPRADPGPRSVPPAASQRADGSARELLIEQTVAALREGRREHAIALLLRYQAGEPARAPDRAVQIMLRALRKELGAAGSGR